jgi:hypothetical protein
MLKDKCNIVDYFDFSRDRNFYSLGYFYYNSAERVDELQYKIHKCELLIRQHNWQVNH